MSDVLPPLETSPRVAIGDQRKWWVLFSVAFGAFMAPLDTSIVNTVLPLIANEFRADVLLIEWVLLAYLLSLSSLLLIGGRLGDLFGDKPLYIAGFALFTLSSMLCGLAAGVGSLVASRVLQAVGGAMLNYMATTTTAFLTPFFLRDWAVASWRPRGPWGMCSGSRSPAPCSAWRSRSW